MRLLDLSLSNFKGVKAFTVNANGEDITISGRNATGKTTIADAIAYLLFGKDSQFKSKFEIKTLDSTGEALHGLDHSVTASFLLDDGRTIALKKIYAEQWKKPRGASEKIFSGHTTDYFVDGVPVKKKEYDEITSSIADEETFKLLTSPSFQYINSHSLSVAHNRVPPFLCIYTAQQSLYICF